MVGDPTGEEAAENHAGIVGALVQGERPATRLVVQRTDQTVGGRGIEGLTDAGGDAAIDEQGQERRRGSGQQGAQAENQQRGDDHPIPADEIARPAGDRHQKAEDDGKGGGDQPHLGVAEVKIGLDQRQGDTENLTVALVEEKGQPQQKDQFPAEKGPGTRTHLRCTVTSTVHLAPSGRSAFSRSQLPKWRTRRT